MRTPLLQASVSARVGLLAIVLLAFAAGLWSNGLTLVGQAVSLLDGAPSDAVLNRQLGRFLDETTTGGSATDIGVSSVGSAVAAASVLTWAGIVAGDRGLRRAGTTGLVIASACLLVSAALYANTESAVLGALLLAATGVAHRLATTGAAAAHMEAKGGRPGPVPRRLTVSDEALIVAVVLVAVAGDVGARASGNMTSVITSGGFSGATGSDVSAGGGSRAIDVVWVVAAVSAVALAATGRLTASRRLSGVTIVALLFLPVSLQVYLATDPGTYSVPLGAGVGWIGALAITVTIGHRVGLRWPRPRRRREPISPRRRDATV